jgi:hypothetical protein
MFGVSAFINYTIAVAVWTRFCFHVFPHVDWQARRWTTQMDQSKASPTILLRHGCDHRD